MNNLPITNKDKWKDTGFHRQYDIFIEDNYHEMFTVGIDATTHIKYKPINEISYIPEGITLLFNHTFK